MLQIRKRLPSGMCFAHLGIESKEKVSTKKRKGESDGAKLCSSDNGGLHFCGDGSGFSFSLGMGTQEIQGIKSRREIVPRYGKERRLQEVFAF